MFNVAIEVKGAYGRSYKTQKAFKKDFNEGKDFLIGHAYGSISDLKYISLTCETLYYNFGTSTIYIIRFGKIQTWVKNNE